MFGNIAYSQQSVFADFHRRFALRGAHVLEIGGAMPPALVRATGVARWRAVDPRHRDCDDGDYCTVRGRGSDPHGSAGFDLVFSSNALEHVGDLEATLARVRDELRPGGCVYAHFGPIWSGPDGHHLETAIDGVAYEAWTGDIVPHWAHLACTERELVALLARRQPEPVARQLAEWIFHSDDLNRLHLEDYLRLFVASGLVLCHLETNSWVDYAYRASSVDEAHALHARAKDRHPGRDLDTREVLAVLRRVP